MIALLFLSGLGRAAGCDRADVGPPEQRPHDPQEHRYVHHFSGTEVYFQTRQDTGVHSNTECAFRTGKVCFQA
jgi:hypothetical protein